MPPPRTANRKSKPTPPAASRGVQSMAPGARGFDVAADLVQAEIDRCGWGISELARRSGVHRVGLSEWLAGRRPLRADYLLALLATLQLTLTPAAIAPRQDPNRR